MTTVGIVASVVFSALLTLLWSSGSLRLSEGGVTLRVEQQGEYSGTTGSPRTVKALSWNFGYGYGEGSAGNGYTPKERAHFENAMVEASDTIRSSGADIVGIQEIDFGSDRSGGFDQLNRLRELLPEYPYATRIVSWNANYIPFPYWPPSHHFGRVISGGAILSKFPLSRSSGILLPKPASQNFFYNLYYLFRFFQSVEVDLGGGTTLRVGNLHLEAFDQENRILQARNLLDSGVLDDLDLLMGDFNTVPADAIQKKDFRDEPRDSYENDPTLAIFGEKLSPADQGGHEFSDRREHWTYPSSTPNRRLDYFFYSKNKIELSTFSVLHHRRTSDHLPILAEFLVRPD